MENEGEEKSGEKGKENAGTKEEEEGKAAGKRGNGTGKVGATRLKTRTKKTQKKHKGNGKPKDGDRKDGKEQQEEREFGTKDTQGKYRACVRSRTQKRDKKGRAKAVKKEEVPRQERRIQLDRGRTTRKARKMHKKPHMKTPHIY